MILTVTLNPAMDVTYRVPSITIGDTHRVSEVTTRPGGKGVNVASVLHALGEPVAMTGLAGLGFPATPGFFPIEGPCRRTLVVTDGSDATGFWEAGPTVTATEWSGFVDHLRDLARHASVVVLSGSLPPGLPDDAYAQLIRLTNSIGTRTILDTSGPALRHGFTAGPDVVKPNAKELADLGGAGGRTAIVASNGPHGLEATTAAGIFRCRPPRAIEGNPTGAGDACVAALARGLRDRTPWPELLADAVALSAASVAAPVAGAVDMDLYASLRHELRETVG